MPSSQRKPKNKQSRTLDGPRPLPRTSSTPTRTAAPEKLPEWFREPPEEQLYRLVADALYGHAYDWEVLVTRQEFLELTTYLAKLRGFPVPDTSFPDDQPTYILAVHQPGGELDPCIRIDGTKFLALKYLIGAAPDEVSDRKAAGSELNK
jgi:hypothetical protein